MDNTMRARFNLHTKKVTIAYKGDTLDVSLSEFREFFSDNFDVVVFHPWAWVTL